MAPRKIELYPQENRFSNLFSKFSFLRLIIWSLLNYISQWFHWDKFKNTKDIERGASRPLFYMFKDGKYVEVQDVRVSRRPMTKTNSCLDSIQQQIQSIQSKGFEGEVKTLYSIRMV